MPATIEALFVVLVFVVPGFVTIHVRDFFLPAGRKSDPLHVTLQSVALRKLSSGMRQSASEICESPS